MATTTKRPQKRREYDDEDDLTVFGKRWEPGHWLVPVLSWVVILTIGAVISLMQRYGQAPTGGGPFVMTVVAITCLFAFIGLLVGGRDVMHRWVAGWCAGTPLAGGAWTLYASLAGLDHGLVPMLSWLVLMVTGSALYRHMRDVNRDFELVELYREADRVTDRELAEASAHLAGMQSQPVDADAAKWEAWTDSAGLPNMIFHNRVPTPNGSGFLLHYELPDDLSISYAQVESAADKLEQALFKQHRDLFHKREVRPGCVRVQPATNRDGLALVGEVFICIDVVDILAKTLHMPTRPEDYTELSITSAFQVGNFVDGTPIYLTIHEIHTLIIGQTQHGKSNLLHVMIRQLARCTDAVLWGLDFKGGDTLRLWLNPYMDGEIDPHTNEPLARSIFDWIAVDNLLEAERMMLSALEAAKRRPAIARGGGWVPSKKKPAIIFLADEISEVVGSNGGPSGHSSTYVSTDVLSGYLTRLMKLGTGMGIYVITASQRGTVGNVGSGDAKSQQKGRILLPVTEGASDVLQGSGPEARRLASTLVHKGSVVIEGWANTNGKNGKIWLVGLKSEIQDKVTFEVKQLTHLRRHVALDRETAQFLEQYGYSGRPGGPDPEPDRMAWYYGKDPQRPLLAWDYYYAPDGSVKHIADGPAPAGGGVATANRPTTSADMLGLGDIPSLFDPPAASVPVAPVTPAPRASDPEWERREREILAELGLDPDIGMHDIAEHVEQTPHLNPAPGDQATPQAYGAAGGGGDVPDDGDLSSTSSAASPHSNVPQQYVNPIYERCLPHMIEIVHSFGSRGCTPAEVFRELGQRGWEPHPKTIYPWFGKLVKDTAKNAREDQVVIKQGDVFMTRANQPMPTKGFPPGQQAA